MVRAFDRDAMQVRAYSGFGNGRRVCSVVLLPLHERLHVDWRDQPNLMTFWVSDTKSRLQRWFGPVASSWMLACLRPSCGHRAGAPVGVPLDTAAETSCGSLSILLGTAASASGYSQTGEAARPTRGCVPVPQHRPVGGCRSARSFDLRPESRKPCAGSPRKPPGDDPPPDASLQASELFQADLLEHGVILHRIRQKTLQPSVLLFQRTQPPGFGDIQAAIPASCSFNTAMICSSLNLLRFIAIRLQGQDSTQIWRKSTGSDQLELCAPSS